jgi:mercuric ion transport protein
MNEGTRAAAERRPRRSQAGVLAALAAVAAAVGASLCCIGPLLFVTLGVGAGLASTFEPLRPLFSALAAIGLGIGFYVVYGRKPAAEVCGPGDTCAVPRNRRRDRVILWTATVLAVLLWSFNYWSLLLV